jgi:hypothetical protein
LSVKIQSQHILALEFFPGHEEVQAATLARLYESIASLSQLGKDFE